MNVATLLGWEAVRFLVPANIAVIIVASPLFDIGTFVAGTYNSLSRQRLALVTQVCFAAESGLYAESVMIARAWRLVCTLSSALAALRRSGW